MDWLGGGSDGARGASKVSIWELVWDSAIGWLLGGREAGAGL